MSQHTNIEHLLHFTELMNQLLPVTYFMNVNYSNTDPFTGI